MKWFSRPKLTIVLIFSTVSVANRPPSSTEYLPFDLVFVDALPLITPEMNIIGAKHKTTKANFQFKIKATISPNPIPENAWANKDNLSVVNPLQLVTLDANLVDNIDDLFSSKSWKPISFRN